MEGLVRWTRALSVWTDRLVLAAAVPLALACMGILVANLGTRLLAGGPGRRLVEWSEIAFVWALFLGVVLAFRRVRRVRLGWLRMPRARPARRRLELGATIGVFALMLLLVGGGMMLYQRVAPAVLPATGLSRGWLVLPLPLGSGVVLVHLLAGIVEQVALLRRHARTRGRQPPGGQAGAAAPPSEKRSRFR